MAFVTVAAFLIFVVVCALYELSRRLRCSTLPPGPASLPILGNMMEFLGSLPQHETITSLSKKYGDIMTVWFFTKPVIILSSPAVVREAYVDTTEISSRPESFQGTLLFDGPDRDIAFGYFTPKWEAKRKLFYQSIRALTGTPVLERETVAVVQQTISKMLEEGSGRPVDMQEYIIKAVYNMVMILAFGKRFEIDDPEFLQFIVTHDDDVEGLNASRYFDIFPWLQYLPIFHLSSSMRKMRKRVFMYRDNILRWYNETGNDMGYGPENMAQALMKGLKAKVNNNNVVNGDLKTIDNEEIVHMLMDLYIGGTSTSVAATSWLFLEMVLNPDIQEKCYNELVQVIGDRPPILSDRRQLPYIEACIMESFRHHSPIPLSLPHSPTTDITFRGYKIPAGMETILNVWGIHHDPKFWKDPDNFNPENFLDADGNFVRPQHFYTFGAGRRTCPGEAFAQNRIFLMFAVLIQQLCFTRLDGYKYDAKISDSNGGFFELPKKYHVGISLRKI